MAAFPGSDAGGGGGGSSSGGSGTRVSRISSSLQEGAACQLGIGVVGQASSHTVVLACLCSSLAAGAAADQEGRGVRGCLSGHLDLREGRAARPSARCIARGRWRQQRTGGCAPCVLEHVLT